MTREKVGLILAAGAGAALALRALRRSRPISFRGKSVIITGGSRGLGLVMARQLAAEGARLTIAARTAEDLRRAEHDLAASGASVLAVAADVREEAGAHTIVDRALAHYGRVDVLFNNAGVIQTGPIDHMTTDDMADALATHLWGPLHMTLAVLPHMRRQGGGRIVNIASIGGKIAVPHMIPYCTSKFALVGLSDGLRAELAKDGILVTTVCPWLMRTGSHVNSFFKGRHEEEFTWFSLLDSLPLVSTGAQRAARQIIDACRHGEAQLVMGVQGQLSAKLSALFPELAAQVMRLMDRMLPEAAGPHGDVQKTGWESQSALAPSILTRLSDEATVENNNLRGHAPLVSTP